MTGTTLTPPQEVPGSLREQNAALRADAEAAAVRDGLAPTPAVPPALAGPVRPGAAGTVATVEPAQVEAAKFAPLPVLPPPPSYGRVELPPPVPFLYRSEGGQVIEVTAKYWLDYLAAFYSRYLWWPSQSALITAVLWTAHTYAREAPEDGAGVIFPMSPRLFALSSKRNSGKSTLMRLLSCTCPRVAGLETQPTEYGLLLSLQTEIPTLLIDELGILLSTDKRSQGVQQILLNGYTNPDPRIGVPGTKLRERNKKTERVPLFAPIALAGLDVVEKTASENILAILSRGFRIRMVPAPDDAEPASLDAEADYAATVVTAIRIAGAGWCDRNREWLRKYIPPAVEGTHRRYRQICWPLATMADAAGPEWSKRGRDALAAMQATWVDAPAAGGEDPMVAMQHDMERMGLI